MGRIIGTGVSPAATLGTLQVTGSTIGSSGNDDVVLGGTGSGKVIIPSKLISSNSSGSTSTITGSFLCSGGMGVAQDVWVGGIVNLAGVNGINGTAIGGTTPSTGSFTTLTVNGLTTFAETTEVMASKTGATGTVVHDFTESNIWYHSSISANFTMNLTNVPTTNDRSFSVALILEQGSTGRYASALQIDGVAQTIRWANWVTPTPGANKYDLQTFTIIRSGSAWTVIGSLTSHG